MNAIARLSSPRREMTSPVIANHFASPGDNVYFPVKLVPVKAEFDDEYLPSDFRAVVRTDTNQVLGIHGPDYKLITNYEAFDAFDTALSRSALDLDGMTIKDELSYGGARTIRTYVFPNHAVNIGRVGDIVNLQLRVVNSYDGSTAFSTLLGGYRLVCTNGLVIGKTFTQNYARHTKGFSISSMLEGLNQTIDTYFDTADQWRRWATIGLTDFQVEEVLKTLPQTNDRLHERLLALYRIEKSEMGPSMWAFYNALTHYSTHEKMKSTSQANRASVILQREQRIRTVLNSEPWKRLTA